MLYNSVEIYDNFGCDTIIEFDVLLANEISNLTIDGENQICAGNSTTLTVVGDFESYQWGSNGNNATTQTITVTPTQTTTYQVSAVNSVDVQLSGEFTVEVFTAEVPNLPNTISFCTGFSQTYTAPAGYASYTWYGSTGLAPISNTSMVTINQAGDYILSY
ncbi:MAG: hypothetical protein R2771_15830 [Saprospiraceae bacterium]